MALVLLLCTLAAASAQRAPCYECELFKEEHPDSHPYEEIRSHCTYPCECPPTPVCREGVHLITDGCGCCQVCARQQGDVCDGTHLCDEEKGLVCEYSSETAPTGTCRAIKGASCSVGNKTYDDGESFTPDCRTQCSCQNGTYGCVSLCSRENVHPSSSCVNPRLVPVAGKCCRDWMCDAAALSEPRCRVVEGEWSACSASCGVGLSIRLSNGNDDCMLRNETRLCQLRPCDVTRVQLSHTTHHHIRRGHQCKATVRSSSPDRLRFENCTSVRSFHSKFCGVCGARVCCDPVSTSTRSEEFICGGNSDNADDLDDNHDGTTTRRRLQFAVMTIHRCQCKRCDLQGGEDNNNNNNHSNNNDDDENENDVSTRRIIGGS